MNGYKISYIGSTKVLITLLIPDDALTNKNRYTILNSLHAKYRCNKAYVIDIVDENNNTYDFVESAFYNKKLIYIKNKLITSEFNDDILIENGKGIHYFIDVHTALNYKVPILQQCWLDTDDVYRDYYGNGQLHQEIKYTLDNNKRISNKLIQKYFPTGQIKLDYNLRINKYDGLYREWFANGIMKKRLTYNNNKVISYVEYWDIRGNKHYIKSMN